MEKKFTPGPWRVYRVFDKPLKDEERGDEHLTHDIHGGENDTFVASVHYLSNTDRTKVGHLRALTVEEMEANAKLIAAAPDLLEALQSAMEWFSTLEDWSGVGDPDIEKFKAAIKKATE